MLRVAILGPGLLGGSIALALRAVSQSSHVTVWSRRPEAAEEARELGLCDVATTVLRHAVVDADIVVLCTPVGVMRTLAEQFCGFISPHTIVTDVGSVKRSVVAELSSLFAGNGCFIGSHPMAGSDQTGMRASRADLFHGATCIITPDAGVDLAALAKLRAFWVLLGARVLEMLPDEHDAAVALISHLPHAAAAALVQAVATTAPQALLIVGPGFRDTTRVASGPPEMWAEILRENRKPAVAGIDALIAKLSEIRSALHPERDESPEIAANKAEKVREFLASAKRTRDGIRFP